MTVFSKTRRLRTETAAEPAPPEELRVLVMSHSHPRLTRGGAEISAGALCRALQSTPGVRAWFFGCAPGAGASRLGANLTQPFGPDDFLYTPAAPFDHLKFANRDPGFPRMLEELIAELRPNVVHTHHYTVFGVEFFSIIRRVAPNCRIVLTLHEFLGICHNHGQMVKTGTDRLCHADSPQDCHRCFPAIAPRDFFLRKLYIQKFLADVDLFLAPSAFLAERYIAWGLPADRVRVAENMPPVQGPAHPASIKMPPPAAGRDIHVGFFGQMSPLKGISVLIEAARLLDQAGTKNLVIDIFGDASHQPPEFQARVAAALAEAGPNVHTHGPYSNADVLRLMAGMDAIVVPSIWWENSPVVIQEALMVLRPVICADIGGMAEKVRPGLDGWHFAAGRPRALAQVLQRIAGDPGVIEDMSVTMQAPWSGEQAVLTHLDYYAAPSVAVLPVVEERKKKTGAA